MFVFLIAEGIEKKQHFYRAIYELISDYIIYKNDLQQTGKV